MIAVTSPPIADFVQRRARLLRQAIQDGDRRFREDLRLVYYEVLLNIAAKFAIAEACDNPRARGIAEEEWLR